MSGAKAHICGCELVSIGVCDTMVWLPSAKTGKLCAPIACANNEQSFAVAGRPLPPS